MEFKMSKFTVGDLVTLSASGRRNEHNNGVRGLIGIIMEIREYKNYPINIQWIGLTTGGHGSNGDMFPMKEYEIKFVRNGVVPCK
jgi:hypothetical protein